MSPVSTRTCGPNLVAVRRSCRKKRGGGYRQTDRQADRQTTISAALYSRLCFPEFVCTVIVCPEVCSYTLLCVPEFVYTVIVCSGVCLYSYCVFRSLFVQLLCVPEFVCIVIVCSGVCLYSYCMFPSLFV